MPPKEPMPLYYRTELALRNAIASGLFHAGDQLPPESELAKRYSVSRITIRNALQRLEEDGLISRSRGRGTFVRDTNTRPSKIERRITSLLNFEDDILRTGLTPRVKVLEIERAVPPEPMRRLLDVGDDAEVVHVRRLGEVDGEPLWFESRYFSPTVGETICHLDLTTASLTRLIEEACQTRVVATRFHIEADIASPYVASLLGLRRGNAPILACEFAFFAAGHVPVEAARAVFRADRYSFGVELDHVDQTERYLMPYMQYHPESDEHSHLEPSGSRKGDNSDAI